MNWLENKKIRLKESSINDFVKTIESLKEILHIESEKRDIVLELLRQFKDLKKENLRGTVDRNDYNLDRRILQRNLIDLINEIENSDLVEVPFIGDEEDEKMILKIINNLWEKDVPLIKRLLSEASSYTTEKELKKYVEQKFEEFSNGEPFGSPRNEKDDPPPTDFTLTVIDAKTTELIWHPDPKKKVRNLELEEKGENKEAKHTHYSIIKDQKNGELIWPNDKRSEQFRKAYIIPEPKRGNPNHTSDASRLSKIYFKENRHLNCIIIFENHINLRSRIPDDKFLRSR